MDQKIKNFDRNIEQMMNENAVTPPFGMWNRISAGLEGEALPAAAAAPASRMPKRAIIGFMAAAIILGTSLLTAYLVNSNSTEQKPVVELNVPVTTIQKEATLEPLIAVAETKHVVLPLTKKVTTSKPKAKQVEAKEISTPAYEPTYAEVAVPNQLIAQNTSATTDPYYFPPVDVVVPETRNVEVPVTETKLTKSAEADPKIVEKKIKPSSSSSSDKKLRPKKKRSRDFSYGRLNRLKNPK